MRLNVLLVSGANATRAGTASAIADAYARFQAVARLTSPGVYPVVAIPVASPGAVDGIRELQWRASTPVVIGAVAPDAVQTAAFYALVPTAKLPFARVSDVAVVLVQHTYAWRAPVLVVGVSLVCGVVLALFARRQCRRIDEADRYA